MGRGVVIEDAGNILTVAFRTRGIKKVARDYLEFVDLGNPRNDCPFP